MGSNDCSAQYDNMATHKLSDIEGNLLTLALQKSDDHIQSLRIHLENGKDLM